MIRTEIQSHIRMLARDFRAEGWPIREAIELAIDTDYPYHGEFWRTELAAYELAQYRYGKH
jgi:hypothetical protein